MRALAEKREHERDVLLKAMEDNSNFSKMAEEKLQMKMDQIKENRNAHLAAMLERLQEKVRKSRNSLDPEKVPSSFPPFPITVPLFFYVPGKTRSFGAQEQRAAGRSDGMSATLLHQSPSSQPFSHTPPLRKTTFQDPHHYHITPVLHQYHQYSPPPVLSMETSIIKTPVEEGSFDFRERVRIRLLLCKYLFS